MHDLVNDYHIAVPTAFYDNEDLNTEATLQHVLNLYDQGVKSGHGMRHDRGAA